MQKKVLIIGGTGQISTALTQRLAQAYEVTIFNRAQRKVATPPTVRTIAGDRNDRTAFRRLVSDERYDVVFDFICWGAEDAASDIETFRDRCDQFVHISTAWVYGPASMFPTPETHPLRPIEAYGRSKKAAEELFRAAHEDFGFPATIIRFHATYDDQSSWGSLLAGDDTAVYRMRHRKPILLHDRGTHITQFLHAEDAARALHGLIEAPAQSIGQAFNVAGEAVTWRDYFMRLGSTVGLTPRFVSVPAELLIRWGRPHDWPLMGVHQFNMLLDTAKLFRTTPGLRWEISLEEGFRRKLRQRKISGIEQFEQDPDVDMTRHIDGIVSRWQAALDRMAAEDEGSDPDPGWIRWMEGRDDSAGD